MPRVYLCSDDIGLGIQWVDAFEAAGFDVEWPRTPGGPPPAELDRVPDAVILGPPDDDPTLARWIDAWRELEPPPAVLVIARGDEAAAPVRAQRATPVEPSVDADALIAATRHAVELRYAAGLNMRYALGAVGATGVDDDRRDEAVARGSRTLSPALVREALRPHAHDYAATTSRLAELREQRALEVPQIEVSRALDGTITVTTAIDRAADPAAAARVVWALTCLGAAQLTPEPPDESTPTRRAVTRARHHLRERQRRLRRDRSNYYDVLDLPLDATPAEVDDAFYRLGVRFSPQRLGHLDLGDQAPYVAPLWAQAQKAHAMLRQPQARAQYDAWLASKGFDVEARRRERPTDRSGAEDEFIAGQRALARSDVKRALSFFAAAARRYPNHADYEGFLAWARYRDAMDRGEDKMPVATRERRVIEDAQSGRAPRPRALLALALLCAATDDPGSAAWYLDEALTCDPQFEQAKQIRSRLR